MHVVGTFLVIANHDLDRGINEINTLVRLGDGYAIDSGANYEPVDYKPIRLTPAVLQATDFGAHWDVRLVNLYHLFIILFKYLFKNLQGQK